MARARAAGVVCALLLEGALIVWLMRSHSADDPIATAWLPRFFLLQHVGAHAALACVFGATLRAGRLPLITGIAARLQPLSPGVRAYTRRLTAVWTLYFASVATASCAIYAAGDVRRWAVFAELGTPLLLAAMFVGEHWLRYRWHPEFERVGLRATVRAYRARSAIPAASP